MPIVELPNGKELEFPEGTSPEVMRSAIQRNFPEYAQGVSDNAQAAPEDNYSTVGRLGRNAVAGLAEFGHELLNLPHNVTKLISPKAAQYVPKQQDYDYGALMGVTQPKDKFMQQVTSILPSLLLPEAKLGQAGELIGAIPKVGKFIQKGVQTAIPQAGYAAGQALQENPDNVGKSALTAAAFAAPFGAIGQMIQSGNPLIRKLGQALMTGGAAYGGHVVGQATGIPGADLTGTLLAGYLGSKGINPQRAAEKNVLSNVQVTPEVQARLDAANRLGLSYLTPAEATLSPFEAAKQGKIGQTSEGSKLLYEKGAQRVASEENAINDVLDTIYDKKKLSPQKQAAYEETMNAAVPDDFIEAQTKKPVIQQAIKKLEGDPAYKQMLEEELGMPIGDVKPNSFRYWDMVKRILGDLGENAKEQGRPTTKSSVYADTRRDMVKQMDDIEPKYKVARGIAERQFTRQKLEKAFDKKDMTGNNFYKVLQSNKGFNELMGKLDGFPEAKQKLMDMRLLFNDLIPQSPSIRTAAAMNKTSMWNPRELVAGLQNKLNEHFGTKQDVAAVNLMTDPNWAAKIGNLQQPLTREQLIGALVKAFGKGMGQYEGSQQQ